MVARTGATMIGDYHKLTVWQKAMELVDLTYTLTQSFPRNEQYGLIPQIRRAAVSIPANIAEGRRRGTYRDYYHFLQIAFGPGAELETFFEIAARLGFADIEAFRLPNQQLREVMRMLNALLQSTMH